MALRPTSARSFIVGGGVRRLIEADGAVALFGKEAVEPDRVEVDGGAEAVREKEAASGAARDGVDLHMPRAFHTARAQPRHAGRLTRRPV